jgi:hypothetical protein
MTLADLDNRFEWLSGTCVLMIRKIWEVNPNDLQQNKLEEIVNEIMEMIKNIPILINEIPIILELDIKNTWLLQKLEKLYKYPYNKEDIEYTKNILNKLLPIINYYDNNDDDDIKSMILDPYIRTFSDLVDNFKKYEPIIKNYEEYYFTILQYN